MWSSMRFSQVKFGSARDLKKMTQSVVESWCPDDVKYQIVRQLYFEKRKKFREALRWYMKQRTVLEQRVDEVCHNAPRSPFWREAFEKWRAFVYLLRHGSPVYSAARIYEQTKRTGESITFCAIVLRTAA